MKMVRLKFEMRDKPVNGIQAYSQKESN